MSVAASFDSAKQEAFVGQVLNHTSASMVTILAALGDRLGLFKTLAASGPATSAEVAARAGLVERYAREWLGGMASAGYVTYDAATKRFACARARGGPCRRGWPDVLRRRARDAAERFLSRRSGR
jgi:hypothetical protein